MPHTWEEVGREKKNTEILEELTLDGKIGELFPSFPFLGKKTTTFSTLIMSVFYLFICTPSVATDPLIYFQEIYY